jgi:rhamnose utilization protein RhaD (predicted bifunctional aldolase and dehydrogenase)
MAKGGKRIGGKPKGYKAPATLAKEAARELVRQRVTDSLEPMLRSQIAAATGIGHLYTRDKTGKISRVVNQTQVDALLREGRRDRDYWIFTKDPSTQAFTDLLNRAIDKPLDRKDVQVSDDWERKAAFLASARRRAEQEP